VFQGSLDPNELAKLDRYLQNPYADDKLSQDARARGPFKKPADIGAQPRL